MSFLKKLFKRKPTIFMNNTMDFDKFQTNVWNGCANETVQALVFHEYLTKADIEQNNTFINKLLHHASNEVKQDGSCIQHFGISFDMKIYEN